MFELMLAPFVACLVIAGIHCYLGMHIVTRGVIFVDLALAQIAALGAAVGVLAGFSPESWHTQAWALGFTVFGAAIFALGRFRDQRVPQEAIIGIVYAVSNAVTVLVLSKTATEREHIEHMLVGRLLFVDWDQIIPIAIIYAVIAVLHYLWRKPFLAISRDAEAAEKQGYRIRLWDFLFYVTFGVVVTNSVQIAGVLLVFSFLVAPAICAMLFFRSIPARLAMGWALGLIGPVLGLAASLKWDFPPGVSIVAAFGLLVLACSLIYGVGRRFRVSA